MPCLHINMHLSIVFKICWIVIFELASHAGHLLCQQCIRTLPLTSKWYPINWKIFLRYILILCNSQMLFFIIKTWLFHIFSLPEFLVCPSYPWWNFSNSLRGFLVLHNVGWTQYTGSYFDFLITLESLQSWLRAGHFNSYEKLT